MTHSKLISPAFKAGSLVAVCTLLAAVSTSLQANELGAIKRATESKEYDVLRESYKECVVTKGKAFLDVAPVAAVIEHVPIACERELLAVRQFLLAGAFKVEVIDQLIESVAQGVRIDLVNTVYEEALRKKGRSIK